MRLVGNWRTILSKAWSVRLIALGGLLQGAALYWSVFQGAVDARIFFGVGILLQAAAAVSRVVDQSIGDS